VLAGMLLPSGGIVRRPDATGYAPQVPLLFDHLSPREHFRYFAAAHDIPVDLWRDRAASLLERFRFEPWESEPVSTLSEGTRQKLNLALALLSEPTVLLLDEPYAGFEWETYLTFWDYVREIRATGKAVILVSHLFYERSNFDRLFELESGRLREAA
jgi:ABC-type multidrug transport system ATPase subunit